MSSERSGLVQPLYPTLKANAKPYIFIYIYIYIVIFYIMKYMILLHHVRPWLLGSTMSLKFHTHATRLIFDTR